MYDGTMAEVRLFAGNFPPRAWAYCEGQLMSIAANQALFSLLGTTYGGDGRTTFALPDLRGRTAVGVGQGAGLTNYRLGARTGVTYVTLSSLQLPSHTHAVVSNLTVAGQMHCYADEGTTEEAAGAYPALPPTGETIYNANTDGGMANSPLAISGSISSTNTGASNSHFNMMPSLVVNYIICIEGLYPSRN